MKVKVIKGSVGIKGDWHEEGEIFDVDSVMGRHLIEHKLVEQIVLQEPLVVTLTEQETVLTPEPETVVETETKLIVEVKPGKTTKEEVKTTKGRKGKK